MAYNGCIVLWWMEGRQTWDADKEPVNEVITAMEAGSDLFSGRNLCRLQGQLYFLLINVIRWIGAGHQAAGRTHEKRNKEKNEWWEAATIVAMCY